MLRMYVTARRRMQRLYSQLADGPRLRRRFLHRPVPRRAVQESPKELVRATRAIKELIGPTAEVLGGEFNGEGRLTAFEVTHEVPSQVANVGYRNRIERTISNVMPGQWRALWDMVNDNVLFEEGVPPISLDGGQIDKDSSPNPPTSA